MNKKEIEKAINILKAGGVIGLPTETVYGLAASINSTSGIDKIFATKERPFFDPLIVHISTIEQAKTYSLDWNDDYDKLVAKFWPGPLTLILPKKDSISDKITSGLNTVGLRMPNHPLSLELIEKLGHPVAAPSANKFKKTSPTCAAHVKAEFPEVFTLDGGDCEVGIESTIIGFKNNKVVIYRPGMITAKELADCLGYKVQIMESPVAPGHLKHHYMPKKPIIATLSTINLDTIKAQCPPEITKNIQHWELPRDPTLAARVLYAKFRDFDQQDISAIYISFSQEQLDDIQFNGIFNRIFKAASFVLPKEITNKS